MATPVYQSIGTVKRGDAFSFTASVVDTITKEAVTGAASKLKCQGRYPNDELATELVITETATAGTYLFEAPSTDAWKPEAEIRFDIKYRETPESKPSTSSTFKLTVEKEQTR